MKYETTRVSIYVANRKFDGPWKVYIMGQPTGHISDWRGCNYRVWSIKGQPHNGFTTKKEALQWVQDNFKSANEVHQATSNGDGTFIKQGMFNDTDYVSVYFKRKFTMKELGEMKRNKEKKKKLLAEQSKLARAIARDYARYCRLVREEVESQGDKKKKIKLKANELSKKINVMRRRKKIVDDRCHYAR